MPGTTRMNLREAYIRRRLENEGGELQMGCHRNPDLQALLNQHHAASMVHRFRDTFDTASRDDVKYIRGLWSTIKFMDWIFRRRGCNHVGFDTDSDEVPF